MPRGKLSVANGRLQTQPLLRPTSTPAATFQLSAHYVATANNAGNSRLHRRGKGFSRDQLKTMAAIATDGEFGVPMEIGITGNPDMADFVSDPVTTGSEWVFHGTPVCWDDFHASGAIKPTGDNLSISEHVSSSATNRTAYISTTRELSVAVSFASKGLIAGEGQYGYVYLIHVDAGMGIAIGSGHMHRQGEVSTIGEIPIREIFMFQWLGDLTMLYVNLDFRSLDITPRLIAHGKALFGG